jgi:hypothetical protein
VIAVEIAIETDKIDFNVCFIELLVTSVFIGMVAVRRASRHIWRELHVLDILAQIAWVIAISAIWPRADCRRNVDITGSNGVYSERGAVVRIQIIHITSVIPLGNIVQNVEELTIVDCNGKRDVITMSIIVVESALCRWGPGVDGSLWIESDIANYAIVGKVLRKYEPGMADVYRVGPGTASGYAAGTKAPCFSRPRIGLIDTDGNLIGMI